MACSNFPGGLIPFGNGIDAFNRVKQAVQIMADAMCTGCIAHLSSSVAQGDYLAQGFGSTILETCDKLTVYITDGNNEIYEAIVLDPDNPVPASRISTWFLMYADTAVDGTITGEIRMYAVPSTGSPPADWLFCDGSEVSQATYSTLFAAIGTTYNTGGEAGGNFRLPDLRARVPMGTNDAGLPNGANGALTTRNEAASGGSETHTLVTAELAQHAHSVTGKSGGGAETRVTMSTALGGSFITASAAATPTGSDTPHANVQPFLVVNYIIKT